MHVCYLEEERERGYQYWALTSHRVCGADSTNFVAHIPFFMSNNTAVVWGLHPMSTIKTYDGAHELRIEIVGRFQAESVQEVAQLWRGALGENPPRRCIVDISRISGYDPPGQRLLRDMYHHGTRIAAGTPQSLVFLSEISTPLRRGPALVRERPAPRRGAAPASKFRPAAAGE
jgi:hypothetical protein